MSKKQETNLQNEAIVKCVDIAVLYNYTVGKFWSFDMSRLVSIGIKGIPDVFGFRKSDGKFIFLEFKTQNGILRKEQKAFKENIGEKYPIVYGVPRSIEDAREIILKG